MLKPAWVVAASLAYLLALFAIASWADRRTAVGRSVIGNAWVYTLSMAVYCTAWTYFGSVGRAATSGVWFLPVYLGPTLAMVLAPLVLRKMIRIARAQRVTSIADFIASRHGKSPAIAGLVTLIAVVGIVPYMALQLKAVASGYAVVSGQPAGAGPWWHDATLVVALLLAGFAVLFGTRHLDAAERHEGMVAAIAAESLVKLVAFAAVGAFVTFGLFDGPRELFARALAHPQIAAVLQPGTAFAYDQWFALTLLSMLSVILLPRQFQVMVVENVDERHVRRAAWAFPLYLLAINLFVLPIALGGLLRGGTAGDAETFVLSLPFAAGAEPLALLAFIGGLSAATGMVIVETIAVATMVCNDLVMPLLLRTRAFAARGDASGVELSGWLLAIRRVAIVALLLLGYAYFRIAGEAYALVSIGLISFAAVAQFAPALLGGMYWKGGTRAGALAGLATGFALWVYTLMLPSIAKSGWMPDGWLRDGPFGIGWLRPEQLLGLTRLDALTHSLFWSLLANGGLYVAVSLLRRPSARELSQALLFVDAMRADAASSRAPVFWRGRARVADLLALAGRFLGRERARRLFADYARRVGAPQVDAIVADARLVQFVETQLAGAIGSASARTLVAATVDEETLDLDDVMRILADTSREAMQLRAHSQELEEKSRSLERASAELRAANEQLKSLDKLKDDFVSSVTHELRTPLTSIRALAELMHDDPELPLAQRVQFTGIIVAETERLSRLVNQVLDLAKIESGHAQWQHDDVDLRALAESAVQTTRELFRERGAAVVLDAAVALPTVRADRDRLMQVLLNLLSNAAKFVPGGTGRVELKLSRGEHGVVVEVRDNGPGVPLAQQALVFEKFRQGDDDVHRSPGTGLGLPISRQIVEHFGGRMWLQSEPGQGACFAFELPCMPVHEEVLP